MSVAPNWQLTTKVPEHTTKRVRLFIREDGLMRAYDPAGYGYVPEYDRGDWSAPALQWQLGLAATVR